MKTLIFATGESKKLTPLSNQIVTPMLPILNRPVMDYSLELLGKQGYKDIDISLLDRPADIEGHFGDGRYRGFTLTYHLQRAAWGDAGSVRWAFDNPEDTILMIPADILIDLQIDSLLEFHRRHSNGITAVVSKVRNAVMGSSSAHHSADGCENTGVYLIAPELVQKIPYKQQFSILNDLIPALMADNLPVFNYEFTGYWNPLQNFSQYFRAQLNLCAEEHSGDSDKPALKYISHQGRQVWKGVWIGRNNLIHPSVRIAPVFYSNDNNRIEKEVQVGPNVILGKNIVIDEEATLGDSMVLDNTYVGRLMNVQSKIIHKNLVIDIKSGEYIAIKDEFMLMEIEERQIDRGFRRFASSLTALILFVLTLPISLLVALYLALVGTAVIAPQDCMHTDFRWINPDEERRYRKFKLLRFQVRRRNGKYALLGKFLEKNRIVDIPQLINIIKGDLAFVGVKPLEATQVAQLTEEWQKTRFSVPAGLTGLWYVRTDANSSLDQTLIADAYYAAMGNWKEDLKILVQTPRAWFKKLQES